MAEAAAIAPYGGGRGHEGRDRAREERSEACQVRPPQVACG
jgi:hypothetical protein